MIELVKKLDYDGQLARERQLNTLITDKHSFDWVWKSNFVEWLKSDAKVFWIAGKPASGKSTLVNYITDHDRTREIMEKASSGDLVIAKFFFDFRAKDGLSNNFEGLRRSLLYKLLTTSNILAAEVMQHFGVNQLDDQIMLADAAIFEYALSKNNRQTLLFVDGLDEYEGNKPELVNLIDKITKYNVKVCLSSRYEKPFTISFKDLRFQFRMEALNKPGIHAYAKRILETTLRPSNDKERLELVSASSHIAKRSSGVFLWARFAVSEVVDRICEGRQINYEWIRTIIHLMPRELEDIYARIFQSIKEKDKKACGTIFALMESARYDLDLSELFEATLLAGNDFRSLNSDVTKQDLNDFQRYLEAVGAGLIHCFVRDYRAIFGIRRAIHVTVIHKSVRTYLFSRGWNQLFGEQQVLESQQSHHEFWLNICHDFLTGKRVRWAAPARTHGDTCNAPLQPRSQAQLADCDFLTEGLYKYVYNQLPYHAYHYEQETAKSSWSLIHNVLSPRFVREHCRTHLESRIERRYCSDCGTLVGRSHHVTALCNDVQLAVSHRLSLYVEEALRHHPEAFQSDTFVSAIVVETTLLGATEEESFPPKGTPEPSRNGTFHLMEEWTLSPLDGPRASPLATAVLWCCDSPSSERSSLILLLAPHSSRLEDLDMLVAIKTLSMLEVEALLIHFRKGPLHFFSTVVDHDMSGLWYWGEDRRQLATAYPYGPLWEVVKRNDIESVAKSLRYFLDRGEKINSQCGPEGTIFHSVAEFLLIFVQWTWPRENISRQNVSWKNISREKVDILFDMFIYYGADINATGPKGNVLEYVWKQAHAQYDRDLELNSRSFTILIESLIERGVTNSVYDPNGLIPSKARMLAVAEAGGPSEDDVNYYFRGTCSDTEAETYRRQLDDISEGSPGQLSRPLKG